jgi:hypothetical protein
MNLDAKPVTAVNRDSTSTWCRLREGRRKHTDLLLYFHRHGPDHQRPVGGSASSVAIVGIGWPRWSLGVRQTTVLVGRVSRGHGAFLTCRYASTMADSGYERSAPARPYYLESVHNALRLVLLLARRGSVSVSDAARELGLAPSTTHRLLSTMRYRGFAVQSADRSYQPGPAIADLSSSHSSPHALLAICLPHLHWLQQQLDETCHLVVRQGREVRF